MNILKCGEVCVCMYDRRLVRSMKKLRGYSEGCLVGDTNKFIRRGGREILTSAMPRFGIEAMVVVTAAISNIKMMKV
jgi:hypothetical protein